MNNLFIKFREEQTEILLPVLLKQMEESSGPNGFYVYEIFDPMPESNAVNEGVGYVGKGYKERVIAHWANAIKFAKSAECPEGENEDKLKFIIRLIECGWKMEHCIRIVETGLTEDEAFEEERRRMHDVYDFDALTNRAKGHGQSKFDEAVFKKSRTLLDIETNDMKYLMSDLGNDSTFHEELMGVAIIKTQAVFLQEQILLWYANNPEFRYGVKFTTEGKSKVYQMSHYEATEKTVKKTTGSTETKIRKDQGIIAWELDENGERTNNFQSFSARNRIIVK